MNQLGGFQGGDGVVPVLSLLFWKLSLSLNTIPARRRIFFYINHLQNLCQIRGPGANISSAFTQDGRRGHERHQSPIGQLFPWWLQEIIEELSSSPLPSLPALLLWPSATYSKEYRLHPPTCRQETAFLQPTFPKRPPNSTAVPTAVAPHYHLTRNPQSDVISYAYTTTLVIFFQGTFFSLVM